MKSVIITRDAHVGRLTMNRPDKRNALSPELVAHLHQGLLELQSDEAIRVIVLAGAGPAFCAGADLAYLQELTNNGTMENLSDSTRLMELMRAITECPKPVIAMVHGAAIAGGCGLASVCDIVIASRENAKFGYSEVGIGFIPAIVMVFLLRKIGDVQARRLVLTAEIVNAEEAFRIGLVSVLANEDNLENVVMATAQRISENSASAIALSKQMLWSLHGMSLDAGLHYATAMNALARQTDDCKSGVRSFLETRSSK